MKISSFARQLDTDGKTLDAFALVNSESRATAPGGRSPLYAVLAILGVMTGLASAQGQVEAGVNPFAPTFLGNLIGGSLNGVVASNGETIAVPSGYPVLDSFSIYAGTFNGGEAGLNAYVVQWSGTTNSPVGGVLWSTSAPVTYDPDGFSLDDLVTFDTGGIQLNPNDEYLLAFTRDGSLSDYPSIAVVNPATYGLGEIVTIFSNDTYSYQTDNLDFTASFSSAAIPEPATSALCAGAGAILLAAIVRRDRAPGLPPA